MTGELRRFSRRAFALGAMGGAAWLAHCQKRSEAAPETTRTAATGVRGNTRLVTWSFEGAVSTRTALLVPTWGGPRARFPVLVALHGRGEARKPPADGALGWPRDYALGRAIERLCAPPLTPVAFEGYVDALRLRALNQGLAEHPFEGLLVACPYVPDLDLADDEAVAAFGHFVVDVLLPRVRREAPALTRATQTGIDGVSLGGALALRVGLDFANDFGAVGSLQPAIDPLDTALWTTRARDARAKNPALGLRLLTSDADYFRDAVRKTSAAFRAAGVPHDFEEVLGPHDYPFNRGPGAIEMLLWHDRQLRVRG